MRITASNIVAAIDQLPKDIAYNYVNPGTKTLVKVESVTRPEGPIHFKRFNPSNGETASMASIETISPQMIWRIANALLPNQPINFDRVLGGSYNSRSALEALLAHTPQFYFCKPGRIESIQASSTVRPGHKHIMWNPEMPHELGKVVKAEIDMVISEIPNLEVFYDALDLTGGIASTEMDIATKRRHTQIQIALIMIGQQLGFRTWVAQNDKGIIYKDKRISEMDGVVSSLQNESLIYPYEGAIKSALLIDCIWFKNGKLMPAVMEVEHSTGVTSGLTRMKGLQDALPSFPTRYVIVAPDEDRDKVLRESNRPMFQPLNVKYFPYSAVEELHSLCERRKIRGVTEDFLDSFMEPTLGLLQ